MPFAQLTLLDVLQTCPHKCITLLNPQLVKERGVLSHGFLPLCAGFLRRDGIPCHRTTLSHCFFHINRSRFKFTFSRRFLGFGNRQSLLKDFKDDTHRYISQVFADFSVTDLSRYQLLQSHCGCHHCDVPTDMSQEDIDACFSMSIFYAGRPILCQRRSIHFAYSYVTTFYASQS